MLPWQFEISDSLRLGYALEVPAFPERGSSHLHNGVLAIPGTSDALVQKNMVGSTSGASICRGVQHLLLSHLNRTP